MSVKVKARDLAALDYQWPTLNWPFMADYQDIFEA